MESLQEIAQTQHKVEIGEDSKGDADKTFWIAVVGEGGMGEEGWLQGEAACEIGLRGWMVRIMRVASPFFSSVSHSSIHQPLDTGLSFPPPPFLPGFLPGLFLSSCGEALPPL